MNELWMLWLASCMACFLFGRWRGIRDFEDAMIEAGKLEPRE